MGDDIHRREEQKLDLQRLRGNFSESLDSRSRKTDILLLCTVTGLKSRYLVFFNSKIEHSYTK